MAFHQVRPLWREHASGGKGRALSELVGRGGASAAIDPAVFDGITHRSVRTTSRLEV